MSLWKRLKEARGISLLLAIALFLGLAPASAIISNLSDNRIRTIAEIKEPEVRNLYVAHLQHSNVKNMMVDARRETINAMIKAANETKHITKFVNNQTRNAGNRYAEWMKSDRTVKEDTPRYYALMQFSKYGWSVKKQWGCLDRLWWHESNWRHKAGDPSGNGAYGIPQAAPGKKMASAGDDWRTNPKTQIDWGLNYIDKRYGTPCEAFQFWKRQAEYGDNGYGWY